MKLITAILLSLALSSTLMAGDKTKQSKLAHDMREMLQAITDIQRAGFYFNEDGMKKGVERLKKGLHSLTTEDAGSYLPDEKAFANKFAQKRARTIEMYADDMIDSLHHGEIEDALEDYSQIVRQCTSCHSRIRKGAWKLDAN
jgi:type II secretory pathway pseudopilin PulG